MGEPEPAPRPVLADWLTLGNAVCGFLALMVVASAAADGAGRGLGMRELAGAAALVVAGSVLDVADGLVARRRGGSGLGDPLDLMGDAITFGVAPGLMLVLAAADEGEAGLALTAACATAYLAATVLRLARYAVTPHTGGAFQGLSSPAGAAGALAIVALDAPAAVSAPLILGVALAMVGQFTCPHQSRPLVGALVGVGWLLAGLALAGAVPPQALGVSVLTALALVPGASALEQRRSGMPAVPAHATFLWQSLTRFRTTGAVAPSSRRLARSLARHAGADPGRQPVNLFEAGPGTGAVTRELLRHLRPQDRLVIYEANPRFVEVLRRRFESDPAFAPYRDQVRLVEGRAQDCDEGDFDHAVCGIPFTNLTSTETRAVLEALFERLKPGGTLSYLEYVGLRRLRLAASRRATRERLRAVDALTRAFERRFGTGDEMVLRNLPPATARHFRKPGG